MHKKYVRFEERIDTPTFVFRVEQTGSSIGRKPKQRGALRALGVGALGDTRLQPQSPDAAGSIARVPHLVRTDLHFSYGSDCDTIPVAEGDAFMKVFTRPYEVPGGSGISIFSDRTDMAWVEKWKGGQSATWLAQQAIEPEQLRRLIASELSSKKAIHGVAIDDGNIVSFGFGAFKAVWQRSLVDPDAVEIGLVGTELNPELTTSVLEQTAHLALMEHHPAVSTLVQHALTFGRDDSRPT